MTRFGDAEGDGRPQQGVLLVQDMQSVESGRLSAAGRWASGIGSRPAEPRALTPALCALLPAK